MDKYRVVCVRISNGQVSSAGAYQGEDGADAAHLKAERINARNVFKAVVIGY